MAGRREAALVSWPDVVNSALTVVMSRTRCQPTLVLAVSGPLTVGSKPTLPIGELVNARAAGCATVAQVS